jgi:hypothetical protein
VTSPSLVRPQDRAKSAPGRSVVGLHASIGDVVVVPRRGLQIPRPLSFERWLSVGRQLSDIYSSSAWYLGDWLVYGEVTYSGRYRYAIEQTCLDYQTLRNYAWVAKQFSLSRRRDSLSFSHHAEVAALAEPEQDFWLRKADEFVWPVKRLRQEVRTSLAERTSGKESSPRAATTSRNQSDPQDQGHLPALSVQIRLTQQQLEACQAVADMMGLTMEEWAVLALDEATRRCLTDVAD